MATVTAFSCLICYLGNAQIYTIYVLYSNLCHNIRNPRRNLCNTRHQSVQFVRSDPSSVMEADSNVLVRALHPVPLL